MSAGKVAVQVAHASGSVIYDDRVKSILGSMINLNSNSEKWIEEGQTKILKEVKNESQLLSAYEKAKEAGLPCSLITDLGLTELEGENNTTLAIGPASFDEIQKITKRFRLYS